MAGIALSSSEPNLRALVRDLCFEASADTGLFSTNQVLDNYINLSHRRLYNHISKLAPSQFAKRSGDKTTATSPPGSYDMSGTALDTNGVLDVIMVEYKDTAGLYRALDPGHYIEGNWPGNASGTGAPLEPTSYVFLGQSLYVYPEPAAPVTIRITYAPGVALLSSSTDQPFGGSLMQFHEVVAYGAAFIALSKDKTPQFIKILYEDGVKNIEDHCRARQRHRSRRVVMTEPDDDLYDPYP